MLEHIKIIPLAAESLGVRSMCTYVETPDVRILLDAGVSLCPSRFGLPPHPMEFEAIIHCRRKIAEFAKKAEIVTISHYHFDHHTPSYEDWLSNWTAENETARQIYADRVVLMKNPREHINPSQRRRAWLFQTTSGKASRESEVADGRVFFFGKTEVKFSEPVCHGSDAGYLGWVLMTAIGYQGEKFLFAPDVQGPTSAHTLGLIIKENPQVMMLGGPPLYLAGFRVDEKEIQAGLEHLGEAVEYVPSIILEHHVLRDENWKEKLTDALVGACKLDHTLQTAAEFLGIENNFLEAKRKVLYSEKPPLKDFGKWMKTSDEVKRRRKPPI